MITNELYGTTVSRKRDSELARLSTNGAQEAVNDSNL